VADWDFILAPANVSVEFRLNEVAILTHSLRLLNVAQVNSGLAPWVAETAAQLTPDQLQFNMIACELIEAIVRETRATTLPEFIQSLNRLTPEQIRDAGLTWMRSIEKYPGDQAFLANREDFLSFLRIYLKDKLEKRNEEFDESYFTGLFDYLSHPAQLQADTVAHLQFMWDRFLKEEWRHVKPTLQDAYEAFSQAEYHNMTAFEALEAVTGRNMRGNDLLEEKLAKVDRLIFIPTAHLGPYISWSPGVEDREVIFLFGARPPKNSKVKSTALTRSELLIRMSALADETRLRILELLTQNEELCAQDFITALDLSQSSASRHLRQLTASGYISERRRDVAKCYSLNSDRIEDTLRALREFLVKS
jgi:ArsR family transcriptional regulator